MEYTTVYRTTLRLPRGRYQLAAELANVAPPEDPCHERVGEVVIGRAVRNGRELKVKVKVNQSGGLSMT